MLFEQLKVTHIDTVQHCMWVVYTLSSKHEFQGAYKKLKKTFQPCDTQCGFPFSCSNKIIVFFYLLIV